MQNMPSGKTISTGCSSSIKSTTGMPNNQVMKKASIYLIAASLAGLAACKSRSKAEVEVTTETGATPVTITQPFVGDMTETVELNATSAFLLKTFVKSSATGYLQLVNAELGRFINKGQLMFVVKTKEAQSLGNTINKLDSSMHFDGAIRIPSPGT